MQTTSKVIRLIAFVICCCCLGITLATSYTDQGIIVVNSYELSREISFVVLCPLMWYALFSPEAKTSPKRCNFWALITTLILTLTLFIGRPIDEGGMLIYHAVQFPSAMEPVDLDSTFACLTWSFLVFIGDFMLCHSLVVACFSALSGICALDKPAHREALCCAQYDAQHAQHIAQPQRTGAQPALKTWQIVLILLVAWLPYLIVWFPGTITSDQSHQMAEFLGYGGFALDTHYPYFVGLIFSALYRFSLIFDATGWSGLFLICMLQLIVALFVFASCCIWIQKISGQRRLVYAALAFFALFPPIPIYVMSISKDGLHAFLVVFFTLQLIVKVLGHAHNSQEGWLTRPWAFVVSSILVSLTRNNGVFLVAFGLIMLFILTHKRIVLVTLVSVVGAFLLWSRLFLPAIGVADIGPAEALSLPAQIVAANVRAGQELDGDVQSTLERSFTVSLDEVAAVYNPEISDPVKGRLNVGEPGRATTVEFCQAALKLCFEHPATSFVAATKTTMSLYPFTMGTYYLEDKPYFNETWDEFPALGWFASVDQIPTHVGRTPYVLGTTVLKIVRRVLPLALLYTPGTYFWLLTLLIGFSLSEKRLRLATFTALSALLMLEAVLIAAPCGSVRYTLPLMYSLPLMALLAWAITTQHTPERVA